MTLTSHINFDRMTKTKSSGAMCGFRTQISDLESLDIMCKYSQGMMCRNMFYLLKSYLLYFDYVDALSVISMPICVPNLSS